MRASVITQLLHYHQLFALDSVPTLTEIVESNKNNYVNKNHNTTKTLAPIYSNVTFSNIFLYYAAL